jgi:signal transduction histidine kinase
VNDRHGFLDRASRAAVIDVLLAVAYVFTVLLVALVRAAHGAPTAGLPDWLAGALLASVGLPLAVRRLWPMLVFGVVVGWGTVVGLLLGVVAEPIAAAVFALYAVALTRPRTRWMPTRMIGVVGVAVILGTAMMGPAPGWSTASTFVLGAGILAATWTLGRFVRERRLEAARASEQLARQAVTEERLRIARELHDVVAHSMSLVAVKAGVLRHVLQAQNQASAADPTTSAHPMEPAADPTPPSSTALAELAEALGVIESTSRGALTEMRHLLGVLREGERDPVSQAGGGVGPDPAGARAPAAAVTARDTPPDAPVDPVPLRPAPGLAQLPELTRQAATAGVRVDLSVSTPDRLPEGVELSVYRIVQEAVTNVVRHAAPARCRVRVESRAGVVSIQVSDDGPGRRTLPKPNAGDERDGSGFPGLRGGHGLVGMRERVSMYGGTFHAGPRSAGGFEVSARIPYDLAAQIARTSA